ncbi:hypothetical protein BS47DRAFT_591891 [Hydnum rufescens UP504]|uniref:Uncharacterized protein n=1 Tax=Hydnum rufescens UP504 TaxID=1448309 RepID=A0A9P6B3F5_9AGAM|nr:hypothetical protein BS47DRAFT_591891 [Hydnum rufescens UP504]
MQISNVIRPRGPVPCPPRRSSPPPSSPPSSSTLPSQSSALEHQVSALPSVSPIGPQSWDCVPVCDHVGPCVSTPPNRLR